jgi:hypothetical protein
MDCGGCTLCCELLNIEAVNSPAGELCKHCNGKGCDIHDTTIPKECSDFCCAYVQMDNVSINLRPDKCKVIFEKITDAIFVGTTDPNIPNLPDVAKRQIHSFLQEGFSVILFNQKIKTPFIYTAKNITADKVWEIFKTEARKRGSAILHN